MPSLKDQPICLICGRPIHWTRWQGRMQWNHLRTRGQIGRTQDKHKAVKKEVPGAKS